MGELLPVGSEELKESNLKLIDERCHWPDGAIDVVRQAEEQFPKWTVYWTEGGVPSDQPAGYVASYRDRRSTNGPRVTNTEPEQFFTLLAAEDKRVRESYWWGLL